MRRGPLRSRLVPRLERWEWLLAGALTVWAFAPLAAAVARASRRGDSFTGADGPFVIDQLQYMAWVRDSGEHVLIANRFDLVSDPHVFLHPMFLPSGLAWKLGASVQLAYQAWKPIAVALLFAGFACYVRRLVPREGRMRPGALATALFFCAPLAPLLAWTGTGGEVGRGASEIMAFELFPAIHTWGPLPTAVAVGLMPVFLLAAERAVEPSRRRAGRSAGWYAGWGAAAGAVVSWVHPWQGLILVAVLAGVVAWGRLERRYLVLALPGIATLGPLVYYLALSFTDSAWSVGREANQLPHLTGWLALSVAPLVLVAVPALAGRDLDFQERALRLWPAATLLVYFALQSSYFFNALSGMSLPLAILATRGWGRLQLPRAAGVGAVMALVLPGAAFTVDYLRDRVREGQPQLVDSDERRALAHLDASPGSGGVLSDARLGQIVPALTGRATWVGHPSWTPRFSNRAQIAGDLVSGRLSRGATRRVVARSGARYLLAGCDASRRLEPALGELLMQTRRFGCATIYELRDRRSRPSAGRLRPSSTGSGAG